VTLLLYIANLSSEGVLGKGKERHNLVFHCYKVIFICKVVGILYSKVVP
jgi:hypothetical protein